MITAKWQSKGINLNRFIVFLPILFGIGYAALYTYIFYGVAWNDDTLSIALTSTTLSLSIYAITEKLFERKKTDSVVQSSIQSSETEPAEEQTSERAAQTKHFIIKR